MGASLPLQPRWLRPRLLAAPGGGPALPGQEHHPPRRPGRGQVHRALDRRAPLRLHHPRRPGPHRGSAPGAPRHHHRGDRVPARQQPGSDEQHRSDQVRQAQDPPQTLFPAGVHQWFSALFPPGRGLWRRLPVPARGPRLGRRRGLADRTGLEGAAPVSQGRGDATHLLHAQRPARHHLLPAHLVGSVPCVPLAVLAQPPVDRGSRGRTAGVLRRPRQLRLAARGGR